MDQGAILQQFCSMTGVDTDFALSFLEANAWDVEYCINLYLEGNAGGNMGDTPKLGGGGISAGFSSHDEQGSVGAGDARTFSDEDIARAMSEEIPPEIYSDSQMVDDDGVRAPILPKSEVLVEDDPMRLLRRRPKPVSGDPNNVFEMFRDFSKESRAVRGTPDDQHNKKLKTLADIFRPPVDLIVPGPFDEVKNTAQIQKKWLLVNIQEVSVFECQMMNRDTWSDAGVKSIVKSHFVLWQVLKPSEEGARYCRYYPVEILPHIAIIDSRTGERLDVLEGFVAPTALITMLEKFVATHSLDDSKPSRPKPQSPKRLGDLSEEAQLAAAMAASLGQAGDPIPDIKSTSSSSSSSSSSSAPPSTTSTSTTSTSTSTPTSTTTTTTPTPATPATPLPPTIPKVETPNPSVPKLPDNFKEEHANPSAERTCVIQIRTPSGAIKGHFRPEDTLLTVWQYVSLHLDSNTQFSLVTSFPKTTYSGEKLNMTLKQAGAASGIGKATAKAFAKRGDTVVLADVAEEAGKIVEQEIISDDGKALFIKCDVSIEADVKQLIDTIVEKFNRLDVAFNNAGILHTAAMLHEISEEIWDKVYSINCKGVFLCMKHELKQMMEQKSGVIINNSSISGIKGLPSVGAYTTSKHGVSALTKAGALEYAKYNIRVNQIAPGCVETPIWNVLEDLEREKAEYIPVHLIPRFARVDEIAAAVVYLTSPEAAFITGITLPVDGGALVK